MPGELSSITTKVSISHWQRCRFFVKLTFILSMRHIYSHTTTRNLCFMATICQLFVREFANRFVQWWLNSSSSCHLYSCSRGLYSWSWSLCRYFVFRHYDPTGRKRTLPLHIMPVIPHTQNLTLTLTHQADTCCFGSNCIILTQRESFVTVEPFTSSLGNLQHVPTVDAAIAFNCLRSHETVLLLIFRQLLHIESISYHLICPMQLFSDVPNFLPGSTQTNSHSIIKPQTDFVIPLRLGGVFSYFPSQNLTYMKRKCAALLKWQLMNPSGIHMTILSVKCKQESVMRHIYQHPVKMTGPPSLQLRYKRLNTWACVVIL